MTRFEDLTDAEVLALTDEQIKQHVDYECAENGAGLLPPDPGPEPESLKENALKDLTVYSVGDLHFTTQAEALAVVEVANRGERWNSHYLPGPTYQTGLVRADSPVEVKVEKFYSLTGWDNAKALVAKANSDRKAWEDKNKEYTSVANSRASSTAWIAERVDAVREREWTRQRIVADLERYVELADGNEEIGRRFLLKARPDATNYLPTIVSIPE